MFTKNLKKILIRAILNSGATGSGTSYFSQAFALVDTSGAAAATVTNSNYPMQALINVFNSPYTSSADYKIWCKLGTGTTPASEDDYKLEAQDDNLTCISAVSAVTDGNTKVYTYTFNNPTENEITINETVLAITLPTTVLVTAASAILDRTVLDTPITFAAGETKAITYEIGF